MGVKNYLIDGGSGTGKTTVCRELVRRGYQALNGDQVLRGNQDEDAATRGPIPAIELPPIWDVEKVMAIIKQKDEPITFFCGGCRNYAKFIDLLDGVFVLEVTDIDTIMARIDERVAIDPEDWGGRPEEREVIRRLHTSKDHLAPGRSIDASAPLKDVVDEIVTNVKEDAS